MEYSQLKWIFAKKRFLIAVILDFSVLIFLFFYKLKIYKLYYEFSASNLILFCFIWLFFNYIFGVYIFKLNLFLIDSLKISIKNTSKVTAAILLLYLLNSLIFKSSFLSSYDPLFSINFLVLFALLSCLIHIILIINLHNIDYELRNWILFSSNKYSNIFKDNIDNNYNLKIIDNLLELDSIDFSKEKFKGVILSPEKIESNLDFSILQKYNLNYLTIKDWCQIYIQRYPSEIFESIDVLRINKSLKDRNFEIHLKRIADVSLSAFLLIFFSPVLLIFSILIYAEDRGPILYSQIRTGINLKKFRIYKLRSMKVNSEKEGPVWADNNDSRVSKVGKIIRSTRIDELPQLWSVLKGEMSLIGPRPERPEFDKFLIKKIPFYSIRYSIKPGLSGWAQVNYPYGASEEDSYNKLSYDLFYMENFSFILDFLILFKTIRLVINARGSQKGSKV